MMSRLNDSDETSTLAPLPATSAASHSGGLFSSQSETSKLTTGSKPSTESQTGFLSQSPEAETGEPGQLITSAADWAQSAGATPPEEEEGEEEEGREDDDDHQELGNINNFHLQKMFLDSDK